MRPRCRPNARVYAVVSAAHGEAGFGTHSEIAAEVRRRVPGARTTRKNIGNILWERRHPKRLRAVYSRPVALYWAAKDRASKQGREFTITREYVERLVAPMVCQATGLGLEWDDELRAPLRPSLDRIDSSLGYTEDNTRVVCWLFNQMKGQFSDEDFEAVARAFLRMRSSTDT